MISKEGAEDVFAIKVSRGFLSVPVGSAIFCLIACAVWWPAGLFSSGYSCIIDRVFNVLWLTSVISWTGRVAACCTGSPNYCSLRRVQQIYGQWEESGIPTITPGARIKLTICNLNRLNTPASREKHNQPGRGLEEINFKDSVLFLLSLSLFCPSCYLLAHLFLTFSYRLSASLSNSLALTPLHSFLHLWLCFSSVALSPSLS